MIHDMLMDARFSRHLGAALPLAIVLTTLVGCQDNQQAQLPQGTLKTTQVFAESGTQLGQFVYPRAMDVFTQSGGTYAAIVDKTARIQIMDLTTGDIIGAIHTPKWDRGKPTGVTVDTSILNASKLAVYIADTHEHRVLMYQLPLPDVQVPVPTQPDLMFGSFGEEPTQFIYPTDVAIETDQSGAVTHLYVSEYGGNDRISRFKIDRTSETIEFVFDYQIGVAGEEVDASDFPNALSRPQSIALWNNPAGDQEIIIADSSHHRVGRFTTQGDVIAWFGDPMDTSDNAFRFPYGITILDDHTMLIAEFGGNRIRCINIESGETLWRYGLAGRSIGQLAQPWASGIIGDQLVILDSGNSRLQVCDLPIGISKIGQEYIHTNMTNMTNTTSGVQSP